MSRTVKTAKNTIVGFVCTGISYILSFVLRALFIRLLGLEYAGVNTLFSDILKILNLADLGFNNAILFKLYKSIAKGDNAATEMYLALYRKICYGVGSIVAIAGVCCIPFLNHFVSEQPSFSEPLWSLYIIILANSVATHFINYKSILFIAEQDRYVSTLIEYFCIFLKHALQIVVLLILKNIYLYYILELVSTLLQGIISGVVSRKKYHLSWRSDRKPTRKETKEITKDVGALTVFKLCRTLNATLDTFLISKFIAVTQTAVFGSSLLITSGVSTLIDTINDGMIASIGDLNARGNKDGVERALNTSIHIMYLIYGTCTAFLVPFMSSFMKWWIGHTLPNICIFVILFNFYTGGLNSNISAYRNSMGLYRKGWKRPAITVVVNFLSSYLLITRIGVIGAVIGTAIANITTMLWYDPLIVYKYGLNRSIKKFFARYLYYLLIVFFASVCTYITGKALPSATSFLSLCWHGIVYVIEAFVILFVFGSVFPIQKEVFKRIAAIIRKA